jgi:hypothetical protein
MASFFFPLDMLSVPSSQQSVIRCLSRQPHLTVAEIASVTKIPLEELEGLLNEMVQESRLIQRFTNGNRTFLVAFRNERKSKREQAGPSLLDTLFQYPE